MTTTIQSTPSDLADGIHRRVPRERMADHIRRYWDTYEFRPLDRLVRQEFGFYSREVWAEQGLPLDEPWPEVMLRFHYDPDVSCSLGGVGWCEAPFAPVFPEKVLEARGEDCELAQDFAGRKVLYFKGRRSGFMPEYVEHPVKNMKTWIEDVKWRLDPHHPDRWLKTAENLAKGRAAAAEGKMIRQHVGGGYMYLRSLIGPEDLLYKFYDEPELIHDCMRTWFTIADTVCARHQQEVTFDEVYFGEDICYNHGSLISPEMMHEFLFPYYQQLLTNIRRRQIDKTRHLYIHLDTDGDCRPVIPLYRDAIGMDVISPIEVASGCDVVQIGRDYPGLILRGGIDKRILASGRPAIDAMLQRIIPSMKARGGFIPTCDHGVPAEVPLADYQYYRDRIKDFGG